MIGILRPHFLYDRLQDIPVEVLQKHQIWGLILDLDNTIAPWNDRSLTSEVIAWFEMIKKVGIKACIVSNNTHPERVAAVADTLEILYVHNAAKPRKKAFELGKAALGLPTAQIAVIGDQLFTDIFGGNRSKMKTILVSPIHEKEFAGTKVLRFMEMLIGRRIKYSGNQV